MNSTFVIALGVPARHLEAIATVRDRISAEMRGVFHCTWASWMPIGTTAHADEKQLSALELVLQEEFARQRPSVAPVRFVDRGTYLAAEFSGADQFVARLREVAEAIFPHISLAPPPLSMPVLTTCVPGASNAALQKTQNVVLPQAQIPLSHLLVYSLKRDKLWSHERSFELDRLAA